MSSSLSLWPDTGYHFTSQHLWRMPPPWPSLSPSFHTFYIQTRAPGSLWVWHNCISEVPAASSGNTEPRTSAWWQRSGPPSCGSEANKTECKIQGVDQGTEGRCGRGKSVRREGLTFSCVPKSTPMMYFSATSSKASLGHSENQLMVVQFTKAGYWRIQFLERRGGH